ncbi:MAG: class I SAM-dependent methyltransferase [Bacteroidetes bacterium]|nr:class I SAM-dependent methyltransferase [Bacteroidota bacterium]
METFKNYPLEYHEIEIGQKTYRFAMVRDSWQLLDKIDPEAFREDEKMPYWAEIWTGSIPISRFLVSQAFAAGSTFLEIGAGVGVISAVLSANGYRCVATDYDEDALGFCRLNGELNGSGTLLETAFLDWRKPDLTEKFDYIVGSDIVYEVRNMLPILDVAEKNLKPGGTFFFSDPGRRPMEHLKTLIRETSFTMTAVHSERIQFRHTDQEVTIYAIRK